MALCGGHRYQRAGVRISEMHTMACAGDIEGHHNVGHGNNQIYLFYFKLEQLQVQVRNQNGFTTKRRIKTGFFNNTFTDKVEADK